MDKVEDFLEKHIAEIIGFLFAIFGTISVISGIVTYFSNQAFMQNAVETNAVIDYIDVEEDGDKTNFDVFVSYEFEGTYYSDVYLGFYSTGMQEGQSIVVYLNPDSPREIETIAGNWFSVLMNLGLGGLIAVTGYCMLAFIVRDKTRRERLLENGQRLNAIIDCIARDDSIKINGRNPYRIYCRYNNPIDGSIYKFKSDPLEFNPYDSYHEGDIISVYVEPDDYKKYYVDAIDKMSVYVSDYT